MTLDDYFDSIERLLSANGLVFEEGAIMLALAHPEKTRGRIEGRIVLSERTFLEVREQVEIRRDGSAERISYAYYVILDGAEFVGYDHAPDHPVPTHVHDRDHVSYPDRLRSLKEVIETAWDVSSDEDHWELAGPEIEEHADSRRCPAPDELAGSRAPARRAASDPGERVAGPLADPPGV